MTAKAIDAVAGVAEVGGASASALASLRTLLTLDGLVTTGQACRSLGLTHWTLRRLCRAHGIRRVVRNGRCGSLVDLAALQSALGMGQIVKGA